jgi:tetratricopeptide (TPR) repeat protein
MKIGELWIIAAWPVKRVAGYLFQEEADKFYFLRAWFIIYLAIQAILFVYIGSRSIPIAFILSTVLATIVTFALQLLGGMAGGFYHSGSNKLDERRFRESLYHKAQGQKGQGQFEKAEATYKEIIARYPNDAEGHYHLGLLYHYKLDQAERALRAYSYARTLVKKTNLPFQYQESLDDGYQELKDMFHNNKDITRLTNNYRESSESGPASSSASGATKSHRLNYENDFDGEVQAEAVFGSIYYQCPQCSNILKISEDAEKPQKCPRCGRLLRM